MGTADRKAKALRVLCNGPWPVASAGMIFDHDLTQRGESNAHRTFHSLAQAGLVETFNDPGTGEKCYALKGYTTRRATMSPREATWSARHHLGLNPETGKLIPAVRMRRSS
jgi:hypothetical protein